ncbi:MAG: ATP-binding cassette domain-containing protein, partial [Myxococcales bacterium]|nr:ATP-binding cassette domain-containing protein [Myxococcales bacterium]
DVSSAARIACVHDEIEAFPMGYDTPVGEAGSTLSGGQCQRVALARAVASRPRLLVLDEATSALDSRLERMLHRNLEELGCSKVVIAHRLSTIRAADVILVMDAGKIVERGRHDELLAANGLYRQLWDAQHLSEGSTTEAGR